MNEMNAKMHTVVAALCESFHVSENDRQNWRWRFGRMFMNILKIVYALACVLGFIGFVIDYAICVFVQGEIVGFIDILHIISFFLLCAGLAGYILFSRMEFYDKQEIKSTHAIGTWSGWLVVISTVSILILLSIPLIPLISLI